MSPRVALITALSLLLCATAVAQSEIMPETGRIGLTINTRATGSADAKLKNGNTTYEQVEIGSFDIGLTQTFRFGEGRTLRLGIERQHTTIDQNRDPGDTVVPLPDELNSLSASVAYTQVVNPRWIITGRVGAGSYVTDTGLLSEGWAVSTTAMAIYNYSPTLTYVFGLGYNSNLEDLRVLPIFGLNWRPAPKWSVAVGFPRTAVSYHFNKDLSLGLALSGAGGAYYVKNDPLPGAAPQSLADTRLQQRELRLGLDASWKINKIVRISGAIGQVLYRKFKYQDRDFELKSDNTVPFVSFAGTVSF